MHLKARMGPCRRQPQQIFPRLEQRPQNLESAPRQAAMIGAAVAIGPLGLFRGEFSELAAVAWNEAYIVAALGGRAPYGPVEKSG